MTDLATPRSLLCERFLGVRARSERLVAPLATEDTVVQPMADVSPPKWHLAHTTWFWEEFVLSVYRSAYRRFHPDYAYLFNSYYDAVGSRTPRPERGFMTRPTLAEVLAYRGAVTEALAEFITTAPDAIYSEAAPRIVLGLAHEEQHQELLLTDLKYILSLSPLAPVYQPLPPGAGPLPPPRPLGWHPLPEGVYTLGAALEDGFAFDNEGPRHKTYLHPVALADRLVTCGEYLAFIAEGNYQRPTHWLSEGWAWVQAQRLRAPLYWQQLDGAWFEFTLHGLQPLDPHRPVGHLSYYEAEAYAAWAGYRLPTEAEWEVAAQTLRKTDATAETVTEPTQLHPTPGPAGDWFGCLWQWTGSAYLPYPGFRRQTDALGEYNGKWMVNQWVLRGSALSTPPGHSRPTYRNFFHPDKRWQFTGLRLAR